MACEDEGARQSRNAALDKNDTPVANCEFGAMREAGDGILLLSPSDLGNICQNYNRSQYGMPPISVLRRVGLASALIQLEWANQDVPKIGYQILLAIGARGVKTPKQMMDTAEIIYKVFKGSGGRVTPRDMNVNLRASGGAARTMSNEGLFMLSAMISLGWMKRQK